LQLDSFAYSRLRATQYGSHARRIRVRESRADDYSESGK
jgi:hypothetical protein